jgi:hypothetical protein
MKGRKEDEVKKEGRKMKDGWMDGWMYGRKERTDSPVSPGDQN